MEPRPSTRAELTGSRRVAAARAVEALAEAEALAALSTVAGPADVVPDAGSTAAWAADWERRARDALRRAWEWSTSPAREARDRARRVARRISDGARDVRRAVPDAARELGERVDAVGRAAQRVAAVGLLGALTPGVVGLGLLAVALLRR